MKLNKLTFGVLTAVVTFTLSITAYACFQTAFSYVYSSAAKKDMADQFFAEFKPVQAEPLPVKTYVTEIPDKENTESAEAPEQEFDAAGGFYLGKESLPKAFRDIDHLEIITHDYEKIKEDGSPGVPIPPKGWIQTKTAFNFSRIAISGREIAFQTETVNGVSYRFTGQYPKWEYCETDGQTFALAGQLIMIKNGKWAAEIKANFIEECGC